MHFLSFYTIITIGVSDGSCKIAWYSDVTSHKPCNIYLVLCALQRHVRQTMQYVVLLTRVDMHLGQSEYVDL